MFLSSLKLHACDLHWRAFGNQGAFADRMRQDGIFWDEGVLGPDVCDAVRRKIDSLIDSKCNDLWVDSEGSDHRIWHYERYHPEIFAEVDIDEQVVSIEKYLGRRVTKRYLMANRVDPIASGLGSGGGLHRDSSFSRQVKILWYLTDVDQDNGPFSYLIGSAEMAGFDVGGEKRFDPRLDHLLPVVGEELKRYAAPVGSRIVVDTRGIHMGQPPVSRKRYTLTLYTEYGGFPF